MLKKRKWLIWFIVLVLLCIAIVVFTFKNEQPPISFGATPHILNQTSGNVFLEFEVKNTGHVTNHWYVEAIQMKSGNGLKNIKETTVYYRYGLLSPGESILIPVGITNYQQGEYRVIIFYSAQWSKRRHQLDNWISNHPPLGRFLPDREVHYATSEWFQVTAPTIPPATNSLAHTNAAKSPPSPP